MASISRKSRNYKEKRSMLTFGQLALPLAALVALALLFVGIKLFFLSPNDKKGDSVNLIETTVNITSEDSIKSADTEPKPQVQSTVKQTEKRADTAKIVTKSKAAEKIKLAGPIVPESLNSKKETGSTKQKNTVKERAAETRSVKEVRDVKKQTPPAVAEVKREIKPERKTETVISKERPKDTAGAITVKKPTGQRIVTEERSAKPVEKTVVKKDTATTDKKDASDVRAAKPTVKPAENRDKASGLKWVVQVGAFVSAESATELAGQVQKHGYTTRISKGEAAGKEYHRVRVGAGTSKEDAAKLAAELEGKGYPVSVVVAH